MQRRLSARAIIFIDGKLVLIRRVRHGHEYWVTPGGGVEEGETLEQAARREVKEEIGIDVAVGAFLLEEEKTWEGTPALHKYFLCEYVTGEIGTGTNLMSAGTEGEVHEVTMVPKEEIASIAIVPEMLKDFLVKTYCS